MILTVLFLTSRELPISLASIMKSWAFYMVLGSIVNIPGESSFGEGPGRSMMKIGISGLDSSCQH